VRKGERGAENKSRPGQREAFGKMAKYPGKNAPWASQGVNVKVSGHEGSEGSNLVRGRPAPGTLQNRLCLKVQRTRERGGKKDRSGSISAS